MSMRDPEKVVFRHLTLTIRTPAKNKTHDHESYVVLLCVKLKYCQLSAKIQFHTKHVNKAIILYQYGLGTPALATKLEKCM